MALKILCNNFEKKNKLFEFLFLGTSFCFSEIKEKDLDIFQLGADFLFLFHLGKRKENVGIGKKIILNTNCGL
jgi:hypothetical protein